jgi:hypothetical protein
VVLCLVSVTHCHISAALKCGEAHGVQHCQCEATSSGQEACDLALCTHMHHSTGWSIGWEEVSAAW